MYLNNLEQLEQNSSIYIYGAGSHGHSLYDSIKFYRSDIKVLGFIDGFKSGELFKLPIYKIDDIFTVEHFEQSIASGPSSLSIE